MQLAGGTAALCALPYRASALDYPARPVRIVVGFAAGGAPDIVARVLAQWLSERLKQSFVIDNRPGAGTNLATEAVARAVPDGYTLLLMALPGTLTSPMLYGANFDVVRDIAAVASIDTNPFLMEVNPLFPAKTVPEFIAYARANPGKINVAATGIGTLTYLSGELFKMMAGVDMVMVPARGETEAQTDLFSGRAQVMFDPIITSIGYIKAGKLRALALTGSKPLDPLPGVPSVGEFVPGYDVQGFLGIGAPAGTPAEIVDKLNRAVGEALADPQINRRLADLGSVQVTMSPAEFHKVIVDETAKWAKVIKFAGIKAN